MKTLIFKVLCFLKMCPIFVGSVWEKCLFPIDAYVVWCPTWSKNLGRYLLQLLTAYKRESLLLLFLRYKCVSYFFSLPSTEQMDICFWDYPRTFSIDYPQILCTVCRKLFRIWDSRVGKRFRDSEISSDPHCWQGV